MDNLDADYDQYLQQSQRMFDIEKLSNQEIIDSLLAVCDLSKQIVYIEDWVDRIPSSVLGIIQTHLDGNTLTDLQRVALNKYYFNITSWQE